MSLILEALKKSEAERRLGQAPDLLSPMPIRVSHEPRSRALTRAAWALLVLIAAAGGYWLAHDRVPSSPTTQPPAPSIDDERSAADITPIPTRPSSAPATPTARSEAARSAAETIANVPLPQDDDFVRTERESMPVQADAIPLPPPPQEAAIPQASAPKAESVVTTQVASEPAPGSASASLALPQTAPSTAAATSSKVVPAAPEPALEALPRLGHLLPSEREGLPPLRLSMHVYDPIPTARFVLIDGKRYREGESIRTGLSVAAIRPDGVALSYHGRRFLLTRP